MEHRWGNRMSADVAVRVVTSSATINLGRLLNVSTTGAFVETKSILRLLSIVDIEPIAAASVDLAVGRIAACVVRNTGTGVGLEWCDPSARVINRLLSAVSGPSIAERVSEPRPRASSVSMR